MPEHGVDQKLEIGEKRCPRHILEVNLMLSRQDLLSVVIVQIVLRQARKKTLFTREGDCRGTGNSRSALQFADLVLRKLWTRTDQAHVPS